MQVVLDTNIIVADYHLVGTHAITFRDASKRLGYSLAIPGVVFDETINKYNEELRECTKTIKKGLKKIRKLTGREIPLDGLQESLDLTAEEYKTKLIKTIDSVKGLILRYPIITHEKLVRRALNRKKPFHKEGRGYRDALIWETVLEIAKADNKPVIFITANRKEYFGPESGLHLDLLSDLKELGIDEDKVKIYKDFSDFNQKYIIPRLQHLEDLRDQLSRSEHPDLNLSEAILDNQGELIYWPEISAKKLMFRWEFESPSMSAIHEVYNLKVNNVMKLYSGKLLIEFEADAECEYDFYVHKGDLEAIVRSDNAFVDDYNWNRHYASASASKETHISISLIYDEATKIVESIDMRSEFDRQAGEEY